MVTAFLRAPEISVCATDLWSNRFFIHRRWPALTARGGYVKERGGRTLSERPVPA